MQFADQLTLDAPKLTRDGFLAVRAKAARSGVYDYASSEVGGTERGFAATDTIKVYRPEAEVFAADSVASFLMKPVTNDHPSVAVTADNWKQYAGGVVGKALRDGEFLAFDLVLMDSALITDVQAGKRELSNGYSCTLDWLPGVTDSGEKFDAIQRTIRGNHIAVVAKGRAGSECAIRDGIKVYDPRISNGGKPFAICDANPLAISGFSNEGLKMKITLDGVSVTLTDASEVQAAFDKMKADSVAALADSATALKTASDEAIKLAAEAVAKDAEIVALTDAVADNAITPAKLREAAKAYADAKGKAAAFGVEPDEDDDADAIKKKVVAKKMGDAAKDYTADHVAISFDALTKDVAAKVVPLGLNADAGNALSARDQAYEDYKKSLNEKAA